MKVKVNIGGHYTYSPRAVVIDASDVHELSRILLTATDEDGDPLKFEIEVLAAKTADADANPEMYSALRAFVAAVEDDGEPLPGTKWYRELTAARAALAKAVAA